MKIFFLTAFYQPLFQSFLEKKNQPANHEKIERG